jgi:hypothetical protein
MNENRRLASSEANTLGNALRQSVAMVLPAYSALVDLCEVSGCLSERDEWGEWWVGGCNAHIHSHSLQSCIVEGWPRSQCWLVSDDLTKWHGVTATADPTKWHGTKVPATSTATTAATQEVGRSSSGGGHTQGTAGSAGNLRQTQTEEKAKRKKGGRRRRREPQAQHVIHLDLVSGRCACVCESFVCVLCVDVRAHEKEGERESEGVGGQTAKARLTLQAAIIHASATIRLSSKNDQTCQNVRVN